MIVVAGVPLEGATQRQSGEWHVRSNWFLLPSMLLIDHLSPESPTTKKATPLIPPPPLLNR